MIVGTCPIHGILAALNYARRPREQRQQHAGELAIVTWAYFENSRATASSTELINAPDLDSSFHIHEGLRIAHQLLVDIYHLGMLAGSEFLDTISAQYIGDVIGWGMIRVCNTERQIHLKLTSGLSPRDRLQERDRRQPVCRLRRDPDRRQPAILAVDAQERAGRHRLDPRQPGLSRCPAWRQGAELRCRQRRGRLYQAASATGGRGARRRVPASRRRPQHRRRDGREPSVRWRVEVLPRQGRRLEADLRPEHHRRLHWLGRFACRARGAEQGRGAAAQTPFAAAAP